MTKKKSKHIVSTEYPDELLMWNIVKALQKTPVTPSLSYDEEELANYFKTAFAAIMPKNPPNGYSFLDSNNDMEELSKKAMEFFTEAKTKVFSWTFLELLYFSISSASAKFFKDNGEDNKTINKFRVSPDQLDWVNKKHKKIWQGVLDLHKPGGDTTSKCLWDIEKCRLFLSTTNHLKPLWEFIMDFLKTKKLSEDLFSLLKKEESYKTLSNGCNESFIKEVISRMTKLQIKGGKKSYEKKNLKRQQLTPLALACDHAAFELSIHPKDSPYSSATLLKRYQNINRGIYEDGISPIIFEYIMTMSKPTKK